MTPKHEWTNTDPGLGAGTGWEGAMERKKELDELEAKVSGSYTDPKKWKAEGKPIPIDITHADEEDDDDNAPPAE